MTAPQPGKNGKALGRLCGGAAFAGSAALLVYLLLFGLAGPGTVILAVFEGLVLLLAVWAYVRASLALAVTALLLLVVGSGVGFALIFSEVVLSMLNHGL